MTGASIAASGRVGRDGERILTRTGAAMAKASIAVDVEREREGEDAPQPMWLSLLGFGRVADAVAALRKGDPVRCIGRLERSHYTGRDGQERESWQCVCESVLSTRAARRQADANDHRGERADRGRNGGDHRGASNGDHRGERSAGRRQPPAPPPPDDDFVDDIPF